MPNDNPALRLLRKCGPYKVTVERDGSLRVEPTYASFNPPTHMQYMTVDNSKLHAAVAESMAEILNRPAAKRNRAPKIGPRPA